MAEVLNYSSGPGRGGVIVAKASRDYRWRRYALVAVIFGWGLWSINDGFIRYPNENAEFKKKYPDAVKPPHPALDIPLNQFFGVVMPPVALLFLGWIFYNSRGMYRFDGQTFSAPGHPSVPIKAIRKIDRSKWDRKGIAYVHYQAPGNAKLAIVRLDDFIYDRLPTDSIFEQLELLTASPLTPQ